jgi:hypothetical protein
VSDRLNDLQRQRALAQEQVEWFDREIARENSQPLPLPLPKPVSAPPGVPAVAPPVAAIVKAAADAESILAQYQSDPEGLRKNVRFGCVLYFCAALVLLVLGLAAFYFLHAAK